MTRDSIRFVDDHSKVELLGQNVERERERERERASVCYFTFCGK
jgi:hypothetical protein